MDSPGKTTIKGSIMKHTKEIIPIEIIQSKIYFIRDYKVMLDRDLAELYGVSTKRLKEQVRRNINKFPSDFAFELTKDELDILRSQIATLKKGKHFRYLPMVFTEHGAIQLASVLNSNIANKMSIQVVRAFIEMRKASLSYTNLKQKIEEMENQYDSQFRVVFQAIKELMDKTKPGNGRKQIKGFR